jgi:hypothetical protein
MEFIDHKNRGGELYSIVYGFFQSIGVVGNEPELFLEPIPILTTFDTVLIYKVLSQSSRA